MTTKKTKPSKAKLESVIDGITKAEIISKQCARIAELEKVIQEDVRGDINRHEVIANKLNEVERLLNAKSRKYQFTEVRLDGIISRAFEISSYIDRLEKSAMNKTGQYEKDCKAFSFVLDKEKKKVLHLEHQLKLKGEELKEHNDLIGIKKAIHEQKEFSTRDDSTKKRTFWTPQNMELSEIETTTDEEAKESEPHGWDGITSLIICACSAGAIIGAAIVYFTIQAARV